MYNDGFHYCNTLHDVFKFYSNNGSNRFCEVEIIGSFTDDSEKSITTSLKVVKEIPKAEIDELQSDEAMRLPLLRKLQTKYPMLHVGGSIGLYLHGIRLERYRCSSSDIDFVAPYFFLPENFDDVSIEYLDCKPSGNDFDETFIANNVKVDYRIDPKQRYQIIEYKGFKYKVSIFETILEAKMRYSAKNDKHKDDIREMCGVVEKPIVTKSGDDIPW